MESECETYISTGLVFKIGIENIGDGHHGDANILEFILALHRFHFISMGFDLIGL